MEIGRNAKSPHYSIKTPSSGAEEEKKGEKWKEKMPKKVKKWGDRKNFQKKKKKKQPKFSAHWTIDSRHF